MRQVINSVVVYDSQFGNTEQVAQVVARALDAFGASRASHAHETPLTQLRDVDLLIFGCPTQGWDATTSMHTFIDRLPADILRSARIACFDTRLRMPRWLGRFAAPQLARKLQKRGVTLVVPPEGFFVKDRQGPLDAGEVDRAAKWAKMVGQQVSGDDHED